MLSIQFIIKRLIDLIIALLLLVPAVLFSIVVGILIKMDSKGPALFMQRRLGKNNRIFTMYKFRTMHNDASEKRKELESKNEANGFLFKMGLDPRETSFGRKLRSTGLDELPQIINVLKGEMSLIGPRPLPVEDVDLDKLKQNPNLYHEWQIRKSVKPGITGLWQVSQSNHSFSEMLKLDEYYVEKYSIWKDIKIIAMTLRLMMRGLTSLFCVKKRNLNGNKQNNIKVEVVKE
ncbi:MAG: hypothetical protein COT24_04520 [Candidatus Kerfeldbacteria bacterium CG08_land_8_20_14_0_20_40_16]|uniref:Bacterial sugar transferase domain-containing protein n=1 Tax=Candidatus Kerfeldbacteria bacterium CG08_land_8_20_14_0_20_40_16 TaxID=2014244 RepID=A0A2H0YUY6_9BACT|nr:MAG: hypothetical protein COT24_04520 [Candidatus Kerfeldbacteria bacterium CG08_land_8_20_14_0_20_40_16]